ncbi:MAG: sugar ABC transporter ATP-binding protein [Rudaea sp.]|uniref:sugar ABC transporter ATP-binding protein n=1 Tax=Rudaea sp. TaxID=2136325 RepID=UPI0039E4026B
MTSELLLVEDLHKSFPGVKALAGVRLAVERGEVHALLGENGAGKSTLLKVLAGAQAADGGSMVFDGQALHPRDTPRQRQHAGIVTIYQEFNLLPALSVAENMRIGREPVRGGLIDWKKMFADAQALLDGMGLDLDAGTEVKRLSVGRQQMVEIAKALTLQAKLIVMDEPTAALSAREVDTLHAIVRTLKARGVSVVYVSHRLGEVKDICDRYTVLRDGRYVVSGAVADVTVADLVRSMVGRDVEVLRRTSARPAAEAPVAALKAERITRRSTAGSALKLHDMSIEVRRGEILGFAGLVGAGRTELARVIFGADACESGAIYLGGARLERLQSPRDALRNGITLVPEDRKQQGCFLCYSIRSNLTLPSLARLRKWGVFIDEARERELLEHYRRRLKIKMTDGAAAIGTLSGGNQQKVLLARCMALKPGVLIVDEPTRGIDIGAKVEVHQALFALADEGVAVIAISSELPEVMAISDRIATFRAGRITGVVSAADASEEKLMSLMAFGADEASAADAAASPSIQR